MRVLVLTEYYPRAAQPTLGVWAHRQTLAAREAGADVRVLVLHRPLPSLQALRRGDVGQALHRARQPRRAVLDGVPVRYLHYLSPPRPLTYGHWGAWAAPLLRRVLPRLQREFRFDLIHAHYAVPAGDAVRRAAPEIPTVVSVHGGDVLGRHAAGRFVGPALEHARVVLANSAGTARRCRALGAGDVRVVHLGADVPPVPASPPEAPVLVSVGNLVARKRHADVLTALPALIARHPDVRYRIVGDGPEREPLRARAAALGIAEHVELLGALPHSEAVAAAQAAAVFVLPSVEEAFGVAYVEAMAAGVPAVGSRGEDGPEEIAACGGGLLLVPPGDTGALTERLDGLLSDPQRRAALGRAARETVENNFTWERCGEATMHAYRTALTAR